MTVAAIREHDYPAIKESSTARLIVKQLLGARRRREREGKQEGAPLTAEHGHGIIRAGVRGGGNS